MSHDTIALQGEWTIHAAAALRETLLVHLAEGAHTFDVTGITEIDSAGLQLLMATQRSLARSGLELTLQGRSPAVDDVLHIYGLGPDLRQASDHDGARA